MFEQVDYRNLQFNPFTTIGEDACLITVGETKSWNTMTASWGAMGFLWGKPVCIVFIRDSRYTYQFIESAQGFTVSFFPAEWRRALDFCGTHSGRDIDKAAKTGLVPVALDGLDESERMTFEQANMVFSCTKAARLPFESSQFVIPSIEEHYPNRDYHRMYVGFIDQVLVQES
ncbi:MAG: flavin reductase [Sphaerochaetaceae bacterium]|jgi:flavin reductase (DIM6/NTAB) family NADH-FMN oxidoreductase RutF|nr:flavin reductase [Sphaerochaetaceae bacterium]NLV83528.1 flavoredoxin [Spirochaetales bacterium]